MIDRDPALVKFRAYRDYISIRTISRKHKSPQSFTLPRPSFTDLEADGYLLLDDGYSFALFRLIEDGAMVQIDFTWLVKYSDNTLKGYAETVVLGYDRLAQWIWDSSEENGPETWSMFSPVMVVQHQAPADTVLAVDRLPEREAVPVPVGVKADYMVAGPGPLEEVAEGPRQLVAEYGDGQDVPNRLLRPRGRKVQPGPLAGVAGGEHGPRFRAVFL